MDNTTPPPRPTEPAPVPPPPAEPADASSSGVRWRLLAADILDLLTAAAAAAAVGITFWMSFVKDTEGWVALGAAVAAVGFAAMAALVTWIVGLVFTYRSRSLGQKLTSAEPTGLLATAGRHIGIAVTLLLAGTALDLLTDPHWYSHAAVAGAAAAAAVGAALLYRRPHNHKLLAVVAAAAATVGVIGSMAVPDRTWFSFENERHARSGLQQTLQTDEIAGVTPVRWCDQPAALAAGPADTSWASHAARPCYDPDVIWLLQDTNVAETTAALVEQVRVRADGRYDVHAGRHIVPTSAGSEDLKAVVIDSSNSYPNDTGVTDEIAVVMSTPCGTAVVVDDTTLFGTHVDNITRHPRC